MRGYIQWRVKNLQVYISLHSYGQIILAPWGYKSEKPSNFDYQKEVAEEAIRAIERVNDTRYTFGSIADIMCTKR